MSELPVERRTYEYVCDDRTPRRMAKALNGRVRLLAAFEMAVAAFIAALNLIDPDPSWFPVVLFGAMGCAFLWMAAPRRFVPTAGKGIVIRSSFGASDVEFQGAVASMRIPYVSFRSVEAKGDVVRYRLQRSRMRCGLPAEVFPPARG